MKKTAILLASLLLPFSVRAAPESPAEKEARMKWFDEARFGLFIHWGVYSVAAGEWKGQPVASAGEWIQSTARIPAAEYRSTLLSQFNPVKYDPEAWVLAAKNAGMKYVVITSKHHDGFCLWDSKLTDWDVASTPYGKDLLGPLAEACRKHGMKFCLYHSIMDWSHPDYATRSPWRGNARNANPDMGRYVAYLKGQLKELLSSYGDVGILWFDGEWENAWTHEQGVDLYDYLRTLQPSLIINNRVDKGRNGMEGNTAGEQFKGDYGTPEQEIPATGFGPGRHWESCMTMNDTWGFKKNDRNWKSSETLVRNLIDIAGKGGNYLLNVGPTAEGEIPKESLDLLSGIGRWMQANGDSIHGTAASLFPRPSWDGRSTTRRLPDGTTRIYVHLFSWPENGELVLRGLRDRPENPVLGDRKTPLEVSGEPGAWTLRLSGQTPDPIATVVTFTLPGDARVEEPSFSPGPGGAMKLDPYSAILHGNKLRVERKQDRPNIGFWTDPQEVVGWKVKLPAGDYQVRLEGSCLTNGSELQLSAGKADLRISFPGTGSWEAYKEVDAGLLRVPEDFEGELSLRGISSSGYGVANLRWLSLTRRP